MVSIYIYDIIFLILFILAVLTFLYKKRKNLKREGLMYLYRTTLGIKLIDYIGTKYKKTLRILSYFSVVCGYILMAAMVYLFYMLLKIYLFQPRIVQQFPVFPIMPLVPYVPELFKISFLPPFYFTYWIITIAVIAISHEFSHGIFARRYGVRIKNTGFGFLGPFLAAFVEPDEKQMEKKPRFQQLAILSAGTFANLILAFFFALILGLFFVLAYSPNGIMLISPINENIEIKSITSINNLTIQNKTSLEILELLNKTKDEVLIRCENNSFNFTLITADNLRYLIPLDNLKKQLGENQTYIKAMFDFPATRECLTKISINKTSVQIEGIVIQEIDNKQIQSREDLINALKNYKPGDKVKITAKRSDGIVTKNITLAESPIEKNKVILGLSIPQLEEPRTLLGKLFAFSGHIRDPITLYEPKFAPEFIIFIYNLLLWLFLINLSVALFNMLPLSIFDGGRTFMLTVWSVTKSEKFAKLSFKVVSIVILASLVLIILGYFAAFY